MLTLFEKDYPWSETCCMNIGKNEFKSCDKIATSWFLHDEDICSYCNDHPYVCGEPITKEKFEKLKI